MRDGTAGKNGGRDSNGRTTNTVAANGNGTAETSVRSNVLALARLLGRQIAREQFSRVTNTSDSVPATDTGDRKET